jgi:RNA polymerase sigma-70 factor, ECF subfamily
MNSEAASRSPVLWLDPADQVREKENILVLMEKIASRDIGSDASNSAGFVNEVDNQAATIRDEVLLEQVCQGNAEALRLLFRRYARRVLGLANRILRNSAEADDLLQDVFLYIFRKAALFDPSKGSARSWIIQVTYHRAFNRRQHLKSRHFYDAMDADDPVASASLRTEIAFYERTLEGALGKEALKRIEESLSEDQRQTIQLYFYEGYTIEEIAHKLGQTPGNIYNHYHRALAKIRKLVFTPQELSK